MAKKTTKTTAKQPAAFRSVLHGAEALSRAERPEGWTVVTGEGWVGMDGDRYTPDVVSRYVGFSRTVGDLAVTVALNLNRVGKDDWEARHAYRGLTVEGHTSYNGRCFTRRGIDVSSVCLMDRVEDGWGHCYDTVAAALDGEWERCRVAHERSKTMVDVPGLPGGWRVTPARREQIAADLRAGRSATFTPHGFGIRYRVSGRRVSRVLGGQLPASTAAFFGVTGPLYYETLDCD